jgi:hypothetical protein
MKKPEAGEASSKKAEEKPAATVESEAEKP